MVLCALCPFVTIANIRKFGRKTASFSSLLVGASTPPRRSPERGNVHGACGESSGHTNRSRQNFLGNDCVLRAKVRGHRDVVTVVGHAATIAAGEWITASGEWVNDRTHGDVIETAPDRLREVDGHRAGARCQHSRCLA